MSKYSFVYKENEYTIDSEKCGEFFNDEEKPVSGFDVEEAFRLLNEAKNMEFEMEYYQEACPECMAGVKEKRKFFKFFEAHFYIFTKNGKYVISDIDKEYNGKSYNKLSRAGKVDTSYIVSIIICAECMDYIVQVESCEV